MHPAALPAAALEHALDRCRQPQVGIGDHQAGAIQAALLEAAQELAPETLRLAVADGDPQHLAVAEGVDADGHHHRPRHHLQVAAQAAVEVGGVQVDVGETGMVQRPAQEGFHLFVQASADAAHLGFGDAAGTAQRLHQSVDLAGGDPTGVGLHHHGVEGLVDPPAWLKPVGEEAALAQFGDGEGEVAHLGGENPLAVAVAVRGTVIRTAFMELSTDGG